MRKKNFILRQLAQTAILVILVLPFFLIVAEDFIPWFLYGKAEMGKPYRFAANEEYWAPIENYVVTERNIYILFDGPGVMKCYNIDGEYLHSFHIKQINNGSSCLRFSEDNHVYLFDRENNIYEIVDAEITAYYPLVGSEDDDKILEKLGVSYAFSPIKGYGKSIDDYFLKFGSLWKETDEEKVCVVHRPVWAWFTDPIFLTCWGLAQPTILLIINEIRKKKVR